MNKSIELLEKRASLIANAQIIVNNAESDERELTADEQTQIDAMFASADSLKAESDSEGSAERKIKMASMSKDLRLPQGRRTQANRQSVSSEEMGECFRNWCMSGTGSSLTTDQMYRMSEFGIDPKSAKLDLRSLSKGTASAGGNAVPASFTTDYENKLKYYFPVLSAISAFKTGDGRDLPFSQVDDTSNVAAIVGEASAIPTNVDPSFTKITFKAWKFASPIVKVSMELLQDSSIDIQSYLSDAFASRFGRGYEAAVVSANAGTAAPEGLLNNIVTGVTLATGNPLTLGKLIDLETSVDIAYRSQPGVGWMMNDATFAAVRKLADANGQPLYLGDLHLGNVPTLLGYPVYISNQLTSYSSPGTGQPLILFGAFGKYRWRTAQDRVLTKLTELYAATGEVGFVMLERADGRYIQTGVVKAMNSF